MQKETSQIMSNKFQLGAPLSKQDTDIINGNSVVLDNSPHLPPHSSHNDSGNLELNNCNLLIKSPSAIYTNYLHKHTYALRKIGQTFYVRRRVPKIIVSAMGKKEIWKSLKTDSYQTAVKRSYGVTGTGVKSLIQGI